MLRAVLGLSALCCAANFSSAEMIVPAETGYSAPDPYSLRFSSGSGVSRWRDAGTQLRWYGELRHAGTLDVSVIVRLDEGRLQAYRLTVADQPKSATVTGLGKDVDVRVEFGSVQIAQTGYHSFVLEALPGEPSVANDYGNVRSLVLAGPPADDSHFNKLERRNAASIHLMYPVPAGTKVSAFYCEMTGLEDPLWTYYMACGWHRGYFGMQVNSPTERRIIFSVWDSGSEAIDRGKVDQANRVTLVAKGDDVFSGDFGNEGTGGHSHLKFPWKTGETQRFLVTAEPVDETSTIFAGYYYRRDTQQWMLISSWKAPHEGGYLRGLYSFSENFIGANGDVVRKALYGNQWIRTPSGQWMELTTAKFSHDATGKSDRLDRFMGIQDSQFFLSHGGFVEGFTEYGQAMTRPASGRSPAEMVLPSLPPAVK